MSSKPAWATEGVLALGEKPRRMGLGVAQQQRILLYRKLFRSKKQIFEVQIIILSISVISLGSFPLTVDRN